MTTDDLRDELASVRDRLDRLVDQRLLTPFEFEVEDEATYRALAARELLLLDAIRRACE